MEAAYYEKLDETTVQCTLCPTRCRIADGKYGACNIRLNEGGILYADAYSEVVSLSRDPVEKKPLYHFHPGRIIMSTGPNGCNFRCGFCQNSAISQGKVPTRQVTPEEMADIGMRDGSIGIAYTYTEPFIWFEYVRDTGRLVHERGGKNVMVSNGYVEEAPLRELLPVIDAANIDVKSMRPDFYTKICGGKLDDVLRSVEILAGSCHVELTNLVIPGYNDTDDDFARLFDWIASVDPSIPLHLSRYFPQYRFTAPPTEQSTLERAYRMASEKLNYVYVGNTSIPGTADTHCPSCGAVLVRRTGYSVDLSGIADGSCAGCGRKADFAGV